MEEDKIEIMSPDGQESQKTLESPEKPENKLQETIKKIKETAVEEDPRPSQ